MATKRITIDQLVKQADPTHNKEANYPVEYTMSNGRVFRGYYKKRGAYADE